jgi:hypothetical protein
MVTEGMSTGPKVMNDWWWQVVAEFYARVAGAKYFDPSEPPPDLYAAGMLELIRWLREEPELAGMKPGVQRRTLTLRPMNSEERVRVRWVATGLYEIEMPGGPAMFDFPWDGKILVPDDMVLQALINCKNHLETNAA